MLSLFTPRVYCSDLHISNDYSKFKPGKNMCSRLAIIRHVQDFFDTGLLEMPDYRAIPCVIAEL